MTSDAVNHATARAADEPSTAASNRDAGSLAAAIDAAAGRWFATLGYTPFAFQRAVWSAYAHGESGLIHAPTGMGKTYAAWLGPLVLGPSGTSRDPPP